MLIPLYQRFSVGVNTLASFITVVVTASSILGYTLDGAELNIPILTGLLDRLSEANFPGRLICFLFGAAALAHVATWIIGSSTQDSRDAGAVLAVIAGIVWPALLIGMSLFLFERETKAAPLASIMSIVGLVLGCWILKVELRTLGSSSTLIMYHRALALCAVAISASSIILIMEFGR